MTRSDSLLQRIPLAAVLRRGCRDQPGSRDSDQAAAALVHLEMMGAQTRLKAAEQLRCGGIWIQSQILKAEPTGCADVWTCSVRKEGVKESEKC